MFRISQNGQQPIVDVDTLDQLEPAGSLPRRRDHCRPVAVWSHFETMGRRHQMARWISRD